MCDCGERPCAIDEADAGRLQEVFQDDRLEGVGAIGVPPSHYAGKGMDVFEIIDAFDLDFYEGNALKYLLRHRKKDGIKDLQKARHYLDEVIVRAQRTR